MCLKNSVYCVNAVSNKKRFNSTDGSIVDVGGTTLDGSLPNFWVPKTATLLLLSGVISPEGATFSFQSPKIMETRQLMCSGLWATSAVTCIPVFQQEKQHKACITIEKKQSKRSNQASKLCRCWNPAPTEHEKTFSFKNCIVSQNIYWPQVQSASRYWSAYVLQHVQLTKSQPKPAYLCCLLCCLLYSPLNPACSFQN